MAKKREKRSLTGVFNNVMGEEQENQEKQVEKTSSEPEVNKQEEGIISQFKKKKQKKKVEDTHTRVTFLVKNELKAEIDRLFKKQGYGFKTFFINKAIEEQLNRIKEEYEKNKKN